MLISFETSLRADAAVPLRPAWAVHPPGEWMATVTSAALLHDTALVPIREKVLAGVRLSFDDGLALYRTQDLLGLGALGRW